MFASLRNAKQCCCTTMLHGTHHFGDDWTMNSNGQCNFMTSQLCSACPFDRQTSQYLNIIRPRFHAYTTYLRCFKNLKMVTNQWQSQQTFMSLRLQKLFMNSMQTCNSVTFYFMKNSFSDVSR